MDTPPDAPRPEPDPYEQAADLRTAMDAADDVPSAVMHARAEELYDHVHMLELFHPQDPVWIEHREAANAMLQHVKRGGPHGRDVDRTIHDAVSDQHLVAVEVMGPVPGGGWKGGAHLSWADQDGHDQEQEGDPLRVRLSWGTAHAEVWADRIRHVEGPSPLMLLLLVHAAEVPYPQWMASQHWQMAARAVVLARLGYAVSRVVPAATDGRMPPGVAGKVSFYAAESRPVSSQDALTADVGSAMVAMRYLAEQGHSEKTLTAVEHMVGGWFPAQQQLNGGAPVSYIRAAQDASRLAQGPVAEAVIARLVELLSEGPVEGAELDEMIARLRQEDHEK